MSMHNAATTPITLLPPDVLVPERYSLLVHSQLCDNCGSFKQYSSVFAFQTLKSTIGRPVSNFVPCPKFKYKLPIAVVRRPTEHVPACFECVETSLLDLSALEPPPARHVATGAHGVDPDKPPKAARRADPPLSTDDLLKGF